MFTFSVYLWLYVLQKQVLRCLAAWMDWAVYTPDFLFNLENIFLGHTEKNSQSEVRMLSYNHLDDVFWKIDNSKKTTSK